MTPTEAALRAALENIRRHEGAGCTGGHGCGTAFVLANEALAAPPHGQDAGEETEPNWGPRFDVGVCRRHGEHGCASCLAYAVRDFQARLTEAEGLLREAACESCEVEGCVRIRAFLEKPPEGGT